MIDHSGIFGEVDLKFGQCSFCLWFIEQPKLTSYNDDDWLIIFSGYLDGYLSK